jgi:flagellar basal body-associated protein FliL
MKNLNEYLEKARSFSDVKKIIIIVIVVILVASVLVVFWVNSTKQRIVKIGESINNLNSSLGSIPLPGATETTSPTNENLTK